MNLKVDMRRISEFIKKIKKFHRNSKYDYDNGLQSPQEYREQT